MTTTAGRDHVEDAYVVVAEVIHGPHADPVLGDKLYCSVGCAGVGVYELTRSISTREVGAAFVLRRHNRPAGCVVTRAGRMWLVQAFASRDLPPSGWAHA